VNFPDELSREDFQLFLKECRLAGCDIERSASKRFVWVYDDDQYFGFFEEDDGWLKLIESGEQ
jgi:hypothetical protein